jgi:exopolyphosphatase/guanosine-5'-triphosphate,3'-diphosphate pyrophosphatase
VPERRLAVIDLGSNSFRLVEFTSDDGWWRRTDEIYEAVRIGEGASAAGRLGEAPMERALHTLELFMHFARAARLGPDAVRVAATSAIRDAANREDFLARAREVAGVDIRVLSAEEEARYGYLAAVNSTTLADGAVLDLGGGSLQLVRVRGRRAVRLQSWPLGAVRMTERFLPGRGKASGKALKTLRQHVERELRGAGVTRTGDCLVGVGGTVRTLAVAAQFDAGLPTFGVQGFTVTRAALEALIERLAALPASERAKVPGIKAARADLILAGAVTIQVVLDVVGVDGVEVTESGLREGVFFEQHLGATDGLFPDVREASVRNLAAQSPVDPAHVKHVARLTLELFDDLARAGLHDGDPAERQLLWAAAMLHDIGMTVDYDDHHKHSKYLILNAGLPGYTQREAALIAQIARYHRKGTPGLDELAPLAVKGDTALVARGAALLRIAEQLERSRDQHVRHAHVEVRDGHVQLRLEGEDLDLARWSAARETRAFERAFSRALAVA